MTRSSSGIGDGVGHLPIERSHGSAAGRRSVLREEAARFSALDPSDFARHVEHFNTMELESVINRVSNANSWEWMIANIPLFDCPDDQFTETWYFRWWSFRKHIVETPDGFVITEFLTPVRHAGVYNTISCATGFHIAEGRWLDDQRYLDDYIHFWLRRHDGGPQPHFHKFSSWVASAILDRAQVTGDMDFAIGLLDDLIADYRVWEDERLNADGLFWQFDVRDGMEESISGSRTKRNVRPTINSYMIANARAIAEIADTAGRTETAEEFRRKAEQLHARFHDAMWDDDARFFKVRFEDGGLSDAREAIGFVPWMFDIPTADWACDDAWKQLTDSDGFDAPFGFTTAEQRHPSFRTRGIGTCEWDGAVWPFATSQTLSALARLLHSRTEAPLDRRHYFNALSIYARGHQRGGLPYIGEYMDETTGQWLKGRSERSRYYNHSSFADLVITGLVGLVPREDEIIEIKPLLPGDSWDWFCLDGVPYHGHSLTILWDRTGEQYGLGAGLRVFADGQEFASSDKLGSLNARLP